MVRNNNIRVLLAKEFIFYAQPQELYPLQSEIIDVIREKIPSKFSENVEARCKMIVTELLTNALKHSNVPQSLITLLIADQKITLCKSDTGDPFYLAPWNEREAIKWPAPESLHGDNVVIYEDDMCRLLGLIEDSYKITFFTEDLPVIIPPRPKNLLEHFGLMILAKSADEFTYQFDPLNKTNVFKASVLI